VVNPSNGLGPIIARLALSPLPQLAKVQILVSNIGCIKLRRFKGSFSSYFLPYLQILIIVFLLVINFLPSV
jgi:hypothetical protein